MLLPTEPFLCDAIDQAQASLAPRKRIITLQDTKNGYLTAKLPAYTLQVAIFKDRTKNRDIVAIVINCGPGCMCNYRFFATYHEARKQWIEAPDFLPTADMEKMELATAKRWHVEEVFPVFDLPRTGTTIQVKDAETNKSLYQLIWQNGKFVLKP